MHTINGLPITTRVASAIDHLSRLRLAEAARFADRALQQSWLTPADLDRRLRREPGRRGNGRIREVLQHCADGAAAESERVLHGLLRKAGLRGWVPNYRVRIGLETTGRARRRVSGASSRCRGRRVGLPLGRRALPARPSEAERPHHLGLDGAALHVGDLTERPEDVVVDDRPRGRPVG